MSQNCWISQKLLFVGLLFQSVSVFSDPVTGKDIISNIGSGVVQQTAARMALTELVDIEDQGPFENIRFWNSNGEEVNQFYAAYGGCNISNGYYTTSGSVLSYHHVVLSWFGL